MPGRITNTVMMGALVWGVSACALALDDGEPDREVRAVTASDGSELLLLADGQDSTSEETALFDQAEAGAKADPTTIVSPGVEVAPDCVEIQYCDDPLGGGGPACQMKRAGCKCGSYLWDECVSDAEYVCGTSEGVHFYVNRPPRCED
jgi:hypothetical protein